LYPDAYVGSLADISTAYLKQKRIRGLILDLDNTIIPWRAGAIDSRTLKILNSYKESGLRLCVVSNALNRRVSGLLEQIDVPWVARARKPRRKPFLRALDILGTGAAETAVIGDQLFTDVLGGNRLGCHTVLVVPISKKEFIGTRFVRVVEQMLLKRLAKKGVIELPGE